jgi:hypothetical protein
VDDYATVLTIVLAAMPLSNERIVHLFSIVHECQCDFLFDEASTVANRAFFLWFKTTTVAEVAGEDYIMQAVLFAFDRAYLSDTVTVRTFPETACSRSRTVVAQAFANVFNGNRTWLEELFVAHPDGADYVSAPLLVFFVNRLLVEVLADVAFAEQF